MSTLPPSEVPLWAPLYGAGPVDAVTRFFRKYATFSGRASRSEYWWVALANVVVVFVGYGMTLVGFLAGTGQGSSGPGPLWPLGALGALVLVVWFLGTVVPSIALTVRRFHDANNSGLLVLLGLIPYVGGLILFIMSLLPPNPFGRRFDAPNGVPVWTNGMPYGAFPAAPGEPERFMPMPAYTAPAGQPWGPPVPSVPPADTSAPTAPHAAPAHPAPAAHPAPPVDPAPPAAHPGWTPPAGP